MPAVSAREGQRSRLRRRSMSHIEPRPRPFGEITRANTRASVLAASRRSEASREMAAMSQSKSFRALGPARQRERHTKMNGRPVSGGGELALSDRHWVIPNCLASSCTSGELRLKIGEQPGPGSTERLVTQMRRIDGQRSLCSGGIVLDCKWHEPTRGQVRRDEAHRHSAPAHARQQEVQTATEIDEAPGPRSDHA